MKKVLLILLAAAAHHAFAGPLSLYLPRPRAPTTTHAFDVQTSRHTFKTQPTTLVRAIDINGTELDAFEQPVRGKSLLPRTPNTRLPARVEVLVFGKIVPMIGVSDKSPIHRRGGKVSKTQPFPPYNHSSCL